MSRRIFLHVGTPKSGTTYLQAVLWQNVATLKGNGLLLPGRFQVHYAAAKGVTSRRGMLRQTAFDTDTAWTRLVTQVNAWDGDALISHELFAPASADQARGVLADLHAEVHVVLTARALSKQVPASWQEQVRGGLAAPYSTYLSWVRDGRKKGAWFWEVQDLADIADRWAASISPERVHVVTVPADSTDPSLLWSRYATVLSLDASAYDISVPRKNASLGVVESELLRRVHAVRDERFRDGQRHEWTRKLLAAQVLANHRSAPILTPAKARRWLQERCEAMTATIHERGYDVAGSLDDLRWRPADETARLLSSVSDAELAEATAWTVAELQRMLAERAPVVGPPAVDPASGPAAILELLEHIRAVDTGAPPRPAPGTADRQGRGSQISALPVTGRLRQVARLVRGTSPR